MAKVTAECNACGATGLYRGFAEPEGVAVVCLRCNGTGAMTIEYVPFKQRLTRSDVKEVRRSRGSFLPCGVGPMGPVISYEQFQSGKLP